MSDGTDPDWLTVRQLAHRLQVSMPQIRKWIAEGQFDETVVFSARRLRVSYTAYQRFVQKIKAA